MAQRRAKTAPKPPTKPLAAYRLGLLSRTLMIHRDVFGEFPYFHFRTAQGVLAAVSQMRESLQTFANDISTNVYSDLQKELTSLQERWEAVLNMVSAHEDEVGDWDEAMVTAVLAAPLDDVVRLADLCLENVEALRSWYQLGVAIGTYWLANHDLDAGEPVFPLDPVLAVIRTLPISNIGTIPVLEKLLTQAEQSPAPARPLLTGVLSQQDEFKDCPEEFDAYVVHRLLTKLDSTLQLGLGALADQVAVQPPATVVPLLLRGRHLGPIVMGKTKGRLTKPQYDVIEALVKAGDTGLSKDGLDWESQHTEARKILRRLAAKDADWAAIIIFPDKPHQHYRLRLEKPLVAH